MRSCGLRSMASRVSQHLGWTVLQIAAQIISTGHHLHGLRTCQPYLFPDDYRNSLDFSPSTMGPSNTTSSSTRAIFKKKSLLCLKPFESFPWSLWSNLYFSTDLGYPTYSLLLSHFILLRDVQSSLSYSCFCNPLQLLPKFLECVFPPVPYSSISLSSSGSLYSDVIVQEVLLDCIEPDSVFQ